jgi:hypothetical protein
MSCGKKYDEKTLLPLVDIGFLAINNSFLTAA